MNVTLQDGVLTLGTKDQTLLTHSAAKPMLYLGQGEETVDMYRGNFQIRDYLVERRPLRTMEVREEGGAVRVNFEGVLEMEISTQEDRATLRFTCLDEHVNRFFLRLPAEKDEAVYGCGEQMSYFNLRGRRFPLWTSEPGVGRDKTTYVTWRSDVENKAGGDY